MLACIANMPVSARVNVKTNAGRSYADGYNQVMAVQQQQAYYDATATNATTASAIGNLPVAVDDKKLAESILNNTSTSVNTSDLEACSMIYPNGVFRWGIPESGVRANGQNQCVAVIELRDANTNAILATTTVGAGDSMKCNVDMFPQNGLFPAIEKVELPGDNPPTLEDVEKVLNEEQKQGAGFKIAAAAIIGGVAGNFLAPKQAGDTKAFGTSKTQLMDTAIGATASAGIIAASTYSGKVAGDTIKSTAVNAAAGMMVGNMAAGMAGGNAVLSLTKCMVNEVERDCVPGKIQAYGDVYSGEETLNKIKEANEKTTTATGSITTDTSYESYFINTKGDFYICFPEKNSDGKFNGTYASCRSTTRLLDIYLWGNGVEINFDQITLDHSSSTGTKQPGTWYDQVDKDYRYSFKSDEMKMVQGDTSSTAYFLVKRGNKTAGSQRAYAVFDHPINHKAFGYTISDFDSNKDGVFSAPAYYARNADGSVGMCLKKCPGEKPKTKIVQNPDGTQSQVTAEDDFKFTANSKDASDGGIIDLSNEARAKGTLVGTAAGGALGGFSGYQGAKSEIEQRWTDAVRVYNDSLSNFVCMTGGRFLSQYNDSFSIPLPQTEQK